MGKKIVVIEDDISLKPFWEIILKRNFPECEMLWSVSGEDAVRLIKLYVKNQEEIAAIFVDLFLSGNYTGFDVLAELSSIVDHIPTVVVSASDEISLTNEVMKVCPHAKVLVKPFNVVKTERIISQLSI